MEMLKVILFIVFTYTSKYNGDSGHRKEFLGARTVCSAVFNIVRTCPDMP